MVCLKRAKKDVNQLRTYITNLRTPLFVALAPTAEVYPDSAEGAEISTFGGATTNVEKGSFDGEGGDYKMANKEGDLAGTEDVELQAGITVSVMIEVHLDTQLERDTMESSKRSLMDLMQKGRQIISISLSQTGKANSSSMPPPLAESTVAKFSLSPTSDRRVPTPAESSSIPTFGKKDITPDTTPSSEIHPFVHTTEAAQ